MKPISCRRDIEALESLPLEEALPVRSTYGMLAAAAAQHGPKPAFKLFMDGTPEGEVAIISYRALFSGVNRTARIFSTLSGDAAPVISYLLPTLIETHLVLWGAQAVGIANPVNPLLSTEHLIDILQAAGTTILVVPGDPALAARLEAARRHVPSIRAVVSIGTKLPGTLLLADLLHAIDDANLPSPAPGQVAALFHTGGTTGRPKLARLTHGGLTHAAWSSAAFMAVAEDDVMINPLPLFHIGGTVVGSLAPLSVGATIVHPSPLGLRDPAARASFWRQVEATGTTIVGLVPTMAAALEEVPVRDEELSTVRHVISGASGLPVELGRRFETKLQRPIYELYGMTETSGFVTAMPAAGGRDLGCVGFAAPYSELQVRAPSDSEGSQRICEPGEVGNVLVRGPNVFKGYVDPADDQDAFTPDGWLKTGDLGFLDEDGRLRLTGRSKDVIIRSGHNIDPAAIEEAALLHRDVELCAAVGEPDAYAGEVPVLFAKLVPGSALQAETLLSSIAANISEPPARPRSIYLVNSLPLTPVGKIYKPELRALAATHALRRLLDEGGALDLLEVKAEADARGAARIEIVAQAGVDASAIHAAAALLGLQVTVTTTA